MYKIKIYGIFILIITLFMCSCSKNSTGPSNRKPNSPSNPSPADNATNIYITPTLTWVCSDPEEDPLNYDVYFGTSPTPSLVNEGQTDNTYSPGTLDSITTYYWKIVAKDDHDNETSGEVWQFATSIIGTQLYFEWCTVPAGEYTFGEGDTIKIINYDYKIMKYEVTNLQYFYFLHEYRPGNVGEIMSVGEDDFYYAAGHYPGDEYFPAGTYKFIVFDPDYCMIEYNGHELTIVPGYEDHPVVKVTWFGAWAFAYHYGLRLPTEYEWEKAARGNTGWDYPWGDDIDGSRANYRDSGDPWDNGTTPVGMYNGQTIQGFQTTDSPSPYGVYDMAGNVGELTDSWMPDWPYFRISRDGDWFTYTDLLRSWSRYWEYPDVSFWSNGFRCAVSD